jgi:hypothetical protein
MGPTVQQIQANQCSNSIFAVEWACVKQRMANNPRHQLPSLQDEVSQYTLYGNKLEEALAVGALSDSEASMKILEFANLLDRQIIAERQALLQAVGNSIQSYNAALSSSSSSSSATSSSGPVVYRSNATGTMVYGSDGSTCRVSASGNLLTCN